MPDGIRLAHDRVKVYHPGVATGADATGVPVARGVTVGDGSEKIG